MKSNRSFKLTLSLAVGLLAIGLFAGWASAQSEVGTFTLTVETHWGLAVLPPGHYSFTLQSLRMPAIITVHGEKTVAMVMAMSYDEGSRSDRSSLILLNHGATGTVRSLQLGELRLTFYYPPPKSNRVIEARARELTQQVAVTIAKK